MENRQEAVSMKWRPVVKRNQNSRVRLHAAEGRLSSGKSQVGGPLRGHANSGLSLKRLLFCCALGLLCLAGFGVGVASALEYHGQVTFGGLPVPGAVVTATHGDQKVVAIADPQGLYSFPNLTEGTWTIEVQSTGFATAKQDVTIAPDAAAGAFELKLMTLEQIRAAASPLKVDPSAPVVAAVTPAPAGTATPAAPAAANGTAAATPAKGAKGAAAAPTAQASAAPEAPVAAPDAVAQQASDGLLINGSVNNAATSQYALSQAFGNGRGNGRSLYNGGLSLVLDNSTFDAKQFSVTGLTLSNPAYNNFQAGLNVGGPLKIPHLLPLSRAPYLYLYYQRAEQNRNTAQAVLVPTPAQLGGDFSQLVNGAAPPTIYIPASLATVSPSCNSYLLGTGLTQAQINSGSTPFAGNKVPTACFNSTAQALLGFYPAPNATTTGSADNYQTPTTSDSRQDAFQINVQKQFGSKNNLNGRFSLQDTRSGTNNLFGFHDKSAALGMNSYISWYHRFTQRLSMNASYSFSRQRTLATPFFANRLNVEGGGLINGVNAQPISGADITDSQYWGPPGINFTNQIAGLSDGTYANNRGETNRYSYQVTWNKFRHNVQIGGDFNRQENNVLSQANPRGSFGFTGIATNGGNLAQGNGLADMLLGIPDTSSIAYGNADKYFRQSVYDLYAADDFRVNPELSVNAGVRWEYGAPVTELKNRLVTLDTGAGFTAENPVTATNPGGLPTSLVRPDKSGIAPNVGIAWRPISGSSLLIRAGYQINHETSVYQTIATAMANQTGASPLTRSLSIANSTTCSFTINSPFPSGCPSTSTAPQPTADQFAVDPNFRVAYVQIWNLSAQRDLPASLQMLVTYRGTKGTRGQQEILPNTCAPGSTCDSYPFGYAYRMSNGNSTREEGIVTLRRRLRNGLTANLTYTYSKSLDDDYQYGGGGGTGVNPQVAQDWQHPNLQRGLSTFDQRNVLSAQVQYTTGMGIGGKTLLSGWRGAAYKEWTLLTNISAGNGTPETPTDLLTIPNTAFAGTLRPNYLGGPITGSSTPGVYLNPNAFAVPTAGFGNARRDSIPGPNQFALSASLSRTFRLHDRFNLDARLDTSNTLNHVVYNGWVNTFGSPLYGTPTGANQMRYMTITMRLRF